MRSITKERVISAICNSVIALSIVFILYILLRTYCVLSFSLSTESMSPTLKSGDYVIASQLDLDKIDRGDRLLFSFPFPHRWDSIADPGEGRFYVKRCIALPGDVFEIRNGRYYINGQYYDLGNMESQKNLCHRLAGITSDSIARSKGICLDAWPGHEKNPGWTILEFGPLQIPSLGQTLDINAQSIRLYRTVIEWETGHNIEIKDDGRILLEGEELITYTFNKNYYFVIGDNVEDSQDSRYWGFLPQDHIKARGLFIWFSRKSETQKIRWERIGKQIYK